MMLFTPACWAISLFSHLLLFFPWQFELVILTSKNNLPLALAGEVHVHDVFILAYY